MRLRADFAFLLAGTLALAACGGKPRVASTPRSGPSGVASDWPVKVGNPYQVMGQWFHPKDDAKYDRTGIASWYGPGFHGMSTANGERFDMDMISAAHTTLPLPSYVEVTNLENGRKLVIRVNDRGPFVGNRIIDLSRRSAELLDVKARGTAKVRVRRVYPSEDVRLALRDGRRPSSVQLASAATQVPRPAAEPRPQPAVQSNPAPPRGWDQQRAQSPVMSPAPQATAQVSPQDVGNRNAPQTAPAVRMVELPASQSVTSGVYPPSPSTGGHPSTVAQSFASIRPSYIQVAALSDAGRASWLAEFLRSYGASAVQPTATGLHRVRLGPYSSIEEATDALAKVQNAGYQEARIVTDGPMR